MTPVRCGLQAWRDRHRISRIFWLIVEPQVLTAYTQPSLWPCQPVDVPNAIAGTAAMTASMVSTKERGGLYRARVRVHREEEI